MKVLFICNQNQNRSKTAELIFKDKFESRTAGLYNETPVTKEQILWSDVIIVMEEEQRIELAKRFPKEYLKKMVLCLDIVDFYRFNDPELINMLKMNINDLLIQATA